MSAPIMRNIHRVGGPLCGPLCFVARLLLACISLLFLGFPCEPGSTKARRPLFVSSAFAGPRRQHSPLHLAKFSTWKAPPPLYPASSPTSAAAANTFDSTPNFPPPAPAIPASSPPAPPATVQDLPPPPGSPFPSNPFTSAPPAAFSSTPYTTSVAPVRMSAAAVPLPRSAEQVAPILRGICSIPAFNPCVPLADCVPSIPVIGEATCICPPGYVGDGFVSGQGCNDVNECTTAQNGCDERTMMCIDTPGSFRCECLSGFSMAPNGRTCLDIDECQNPALNDCDPQTMVCHNLEGTYKCVCDNPQQIMDEITKQCRDLDECEDLGGIMNPCEQLCENRIGGFRCDCREGYRLAPNGVSCLDIDECVSPLLHACDPEGIISRCENVVGGYRCICNEKLGFENAPDGVACVNLDECMRDPYICGGALSCCKDLFPPQRFACTVPVDDVLGHTPPLGGITAYGINAALGGSSLTNWIPNFLGLDSGGTLAFPKGLWNGELLLPLLDNDKLGRLRIAQVQEEDGKKMKWSERGRIAEGREDRAGDDMAAENRGLLQDGVKTVKDKKNLGTEIDADDKRGREKTPVRKAVFGSNVEEETKMIESRTVEFNDQQRQDAEKEGAAERRIDETSTMRRRQPEVRVRTEKDEVEGSRRKRADTLSARLFTAINGQPEMFDKRSEVVHSRHRDNHTVVRQSELANSGMATGKQNQDLPGDSWRGYCGAEVYGDSVEAERQRFRSKKSENQRGEGDARTMEMRPPHKGEVMVIAGNSSLEEIRETLEHIGASRNPASGRLKESALSRRRLQLLTALKPGSPYLPGRHRRVNRLRLSVSADGRSQGANLRAQKVIPPIIVSLEVY